jgi:putative transposase
VRVLRPHCVGGKVRQIMAARKRHSPEQVVRKLMTADRLLAEGKDTGAVWRELGVAEATYYRWRNQFGGLKAEDAKRLKTLERENATLKRLLADAELEKPRCGVVRSRLPWRVSHQNPPIMTAYVKLGCASQED